MFSFIKVVSVGVVMLFCISSCGERGYYEFTLNDGSVWQLKGFQITTGRKDNKLTFYDEQERRWKTDAENYLISIGEMERITFSSPLIRRRIYFGDYPCFEFSQRVLIELPNGEKLTKYITATQSVTRFGNRWSIPSEKEYCDGKSQAGWDSGIYYFSGKHGRGYFYASNIDIRTIYCKKSTGFHKWFW